MKAGDLLLGLLGVRLQCDWGAIVADVPFGQVVLAHSRTCPMTSTDRGMAYCINGDPFDVGKFRRIGLIDVLVRRRE